MRLILIILLALSIISCNSEVEKKDKNNNNTTQNEKLKQSEDNLLEGSSWAVCYSGFREGQHPDRGEGAKNPSYEETLEDLQILSKNSNFPLIRLYDCGENSQMVLRVIKENNIKIKVLLGMWLKAEVSNHERCPWLNEPIPTKVLKENREMNVKEIETGIELANSYKDIIIAVAVGNEALISWNDHMVSEESIISYVKKVQKEIEQLVTVADNFKWWADHGKELSEIVDFISVHVYPLWEGQDIDTALQYSIGNIKEVRKTIPNARMVITELGWATVASEFGKRANEEKQLQYYNEMKSWTEEMNITTFFFEAFDEPWKGNPDNMQGAEKHWGIFTVDRKPKLVMKELYPELLK